MQVASEVVMASPLERPDGVPFGATFSDRTHEWSSGPVDAEDGQPHGTWRFFDAEGTLLRIATYERGTLDGPARHYANEAVEAELHHVNGSVDGPYWRRVSDAYRCEGAAFEVGTFDRGVRVGTVRLLDESEQEIARFELGRSAVDDEILKVGVLSMFPRPMSAWLERAQRAFDEERIEEGLAALARSVAKGADRSLLEAAIRRHALPTTPHEAERLASELEEESSPRVLLAGLVVGAEPWRVLRRLASVLAGSVALDMIEAAIAVAPDPVPLLFTRGLLRVLSGNVTGAKHDARTLKHVRPNECELLMEAIAAVDEGALRAAS
jgi:hypothetical protein